MPGIPPGINAIKNPARNQFELIPKNSPKPPQTPAITRSPRERRRGPRSDAVIFFPFRHPDQREYGIKVFVTPTKVLTFPLSQTDVINNIFSICIYARMPARLQIPASLSDQFPAGANPRAIQIPL
jgi:hypothetical protein